MQTFISGYQPALKRNFSITGLLHFFKQAVDNRAVIFSQPFTQLHSAKLIPGLVFTLALLLITRNNNYSFWAPQACTVVK